MWTIYLYMNSNTINKKFKYLLEKQALKYIVKS